MNLENLKETWQQDLPDSTPEISLEKQKKLHLPLEKIRKNMRMEFWMNAISMILLIPLMKVFTKNEFINWTLYLVLLFIVSYYTYKFYKLYKTSYQQFDTYHSLMELKYDLKLNIELYKTYYIASVPFFMGLFFLILEKQNFFSSDDLIIHYAPFILFFSTTAIILGLGSWWLENYYGKYVKQIEKAIKELK